MDNKQLISALIKGREDFLDCIQNLPDQELETPGVIGTWSVKDILVHLTRWEAELVTLIWQAVKGITPTTAHFNQKDVDDINESWYQESRNRPLERVMDDFLGVRNQTIRRVKELSQSELSDPEYYAWLNGRPLWEWIADDSFEHEAEHAEQIKVWQTEKGLNK
jgi:hypothetical protein